MSDLIGRQAAIDAIYHHFPDKTREECAMVLHEVPSAQPDADLIHLQKEQAYMQGWEDGRASIAQPERTGKWIEYDNSHCECPFCHEEWSYFDNEVEHFNYCPNCGARLEDDA